MEKKKLNLVDYFMALTLMAIIVAVTMQVIWRYVFNNSLSWTEEFSRYIFVWTIFIGTAIAVAGDKHIRVDMLYLMLKGKAKKVADIFMYILMICINSYILYYGTQFVIHTKGTYSTALGIPMNIYVNTPLPIGSGIILVICFYKLYKIIKTPVKGGII